MLKLLPVAVIAAAATLPFLVGCTPEAPAEETTPTTTTTTPEPTTPEPEKEPQPEPLADTPKDGEEVAVFETTKGKVVIMVYPDVFPQNSKNFMGLVKSGFYTGTRFHRCIAGFMIQGGDPQSKDMAKAGVWGTGGNVVDGKEVTVPFEGSSRLLHTKGVLSMAHAGDPNGASSQFFIMDGDAPHLDGVHTAFGKVVAGQDVVQAIIATGDVAQNGAVDPKEAVEIKKATIAKWPVK